MIKTLIASGVAVSAAALASPALAEGNVYVNPEFNGGSYGDDYLGGTLTMDAVSYTHLTLPTILLV